MDVQSVHDEHPARIRVGLNGVEYVPDKIFIRPSRPNRRRYHLTFHHMPVADQTLRTVSLVFEFNPLRLTGLDGNRLRNSFQSLDAGHLIRTDGVCNALKIECDWPPQLTVVWLSPLTWWGVTVTADDP